MKRLVLSLLCAFVAVPAAAQTRSIGSLKPAQDRPGICVFASYDWLSIASSKTFDAVFGTSKMNVTTAGADIVNLWKHSFLRVSSGTGSITGERVVIVNNTVYKLGTKLVLDMKPTEIGAGWRFVSKTGRITPYVGASAVFLGYKETSDFADSLENSNETFKGAAVFGGVDVKVVRQLFAGAEVSYRSIDTTPAANSAAASFNEKNFGGTAIRVRLGVKF